MKSWVSLIVALIINSFNYTNAQSTFTVEFRDASTEAANISVFNKITGQVNQTAIPKGSSAEVCATSFVNSLKATGAENRISILGTYVTYPDIYLITKLGTGCSYSHKEPEFERKSTVTTIYAKNETTNTFVNDTKTFAIPSGCKYVSAYARVSTANPGIEFSGLSYDQGRWNYNITLSKNSLGEVTAAIAKVTAGPKDSFGANIWIGVELEVVYECIRQ